MRIQRGRYGGHEGQPETAKSVRDVKRLPPVLDALRRQRAQQAERRWKLKPHGPHSFASNALAASEDLLWVEETLGHHDLRQLSARYARWLPRTGAGGKSAARLASGVAAVPAALPTDPTPGARA